VWKPDGAKTRLEAHLGRVFALAFSRDGKQLASAGDPDKVYVWDLETIKPRLALPVGEALTTGVAFGPDDSIVAGDDAGVLRIWSASGQPLATVDTGAPINAVAVDPVRGAIVTASKTGIDIWSAHGKLRSHVERSQVNALAFDRRGTTLAIAGPTETTIARFLVYRATPTATLVGPTGAAVAIAFNRDASLVFTGGDDGVARVWDAAKGKLLATRDTGGEGIEALALVDDKLLWTGNTDGIARAVDVGVRDLTNLKAFIEHRVPWRLGDDDVVRPAK
jgi:WD40 repeat protein